MHFFAGFVAALAALFAGLLSPHLHEPQATVIFGGDMMFDRTVRTTIEQKGGDFIFSCIDPTLAQADLVVANLEGPITSNDSTSTGSAIASPRNFVFTFPVSTAALLAAHHIGIVNLGNNHVMNFGVQGVRSTISALDAAGVLHFGDPLTLSVAETVVRSVPFAFINYNQFGPSNSLGTGGNASTTISQITAARAVGKVPVVYTHWGIEYATTSPEYVHTLAHAFVDAGAAVVIGSHPHVVEDEEIYRGVPIYYSLGNFIFDQYFNGAVSRGLLLSITFTAEGVSSIKEIPIVLNSDRRTCPIQ